MSPVPRAAPHIRIDKVEKAYGAVRAVDAVSLDIYRGELFSLLGASGCGKTTLLRMLAGFVAPDAGAIAIDGVDMLALPPHQRPVNMMFQSYALFPHMSVADNVAFGLRRDGVEKGEIARRVGEALDLVQMGGHAKRRPSQLSGGQSQRVALARAIVKRPKVLLLDEPLSALDRKLREATRFELVRIQEQVGITFVMVTHDQDEAMSMSSRIAVMDQGRIVQIGSPSEIYEFPASRFVAGFIGSVNIFEVELKAERPDGAVLACAELGADLAVARPTGAVIGARLALAVRPEKLLLAKSGAALDLPNQLPATIREVAYLGDSSIFHAELATGRMVSVTAPNLGRWSDQPFVRDEAVIIGWPADAGVILDA